MNKISDIPVTDEIVLRNGAAIMREHGKRLGQIMDEECGKIIRSDGHPRGKYHKIIRLATEIGKIHAPYSPCKQGCNHCCNMAVTITEYEAQRIAAFTGRSYVQQEAFDLFGSDSELARLDEKREKDAEKYIRVPCTFLTPEGCSIYSVRPLPCRLYHSLEESNEQCRLGMAGERLKEVGQLNLLPLEMAHVMTQMERIVLADIREWFPADAPQSR